MAERALIVELHDVAPHTWADYAGFVSEVARFGSLPLTLLLVPDFHRHDPLDDAPQFCQLLDGRLARGDELVLHGYAHRDEAPAPRSLRAWLLRRVYTHEGEFASLDQAEAARRLEAGIALFRRHGWPLQGFVGPGWLLNRGARRALAESGLSYTSDPRHFYRLPDFQPLAAPALLWSAGAPWRRRLSGAICDALLWRYRDHPVIRLALHPADMRHASSKAYWLTTLDRLLATGRQPLTAGGWLARQARLASVA